MEGLRRAGDGAGERRARAVTVVWRSGAGLLPRELRGSRPTAYFSRARFVASLWAALEATGREGDHEDEDDEDDDDDEEEEDEDDDPQ